jgi:hypothetical protein
MPVEIHEERWPLVVVRASGQADLASAEHVNTVFDRYFRKRERFAAIFDLRGLSLPDARCRAALGNFQKAHKTDFDTLLIADAMVLESRLLRGFLTAVNWLAPPSHPQRTFASPVEALTWAKNRLDEEGIAYPDAVDTKKNE